MDERRKATWDERARRSNNPPSSHSTRLHRAASLLRMRASAQIHDGDATLRRCVNGKITGLNFLRDTRRAFSNKLDLNLIKLV